jgi:Ca2+/Na+ antiporter
MFINFFILNFSVVSISELILLSIFNGDLKNEYPWDMFFLMISISAIIILIQYFLLKLKKNWFYKTAIFYLSFFAFLFFYGTLQSVINMDRANLYNSFEDDLKTVFFGHFIGIPLLVAIVILNYCSVKEDVFR